MSQIVIVVGGSGAGKSFLLKRIRQVNKAFNSNPTEDQPLDNYPYTIIKKYTTRKPRIDENSGAMDLIFNATIEDFEKCGKFVYLYGDNCYGINCNAIDDALRMGRSPIIIVRDFRVVDLLKQRYGKVIDIYIKCGLSERDLIAKLLDEGSTKDEITERIKNIPHDENQWLYSNNDFYDYIVNRYDDTFISTFIASLKRAPQKNYKQISVIATDEADCNNIKNAVINAVSLNSMTYDIKVIRPEDINYNDLYKEKSEYNTAKKNIIKILEESRLIILDLSLRPIDISKETTDGTHNTFRELDTHGLYRLVNLILKNRNNDVLMLLDKAISQSIPFDIITSHICYYDRSDDPVSGVLSNRLKIILNS